MFFQTFYNYDKKEQNAHLRGKDTMMKKKTILPLLLALALTGCSTQPDSIAPTASVTEAPAGTEAVIEAPAGSSTEAPTEPPVIAEAPEDIAYRFIEEELIQTDGLSDLALYQAIDWEAGSPTCGELVPPDATQGIISAYVEDFSGDGVPELLVICSKDYRIDLDFYKITEDTCLMIGSYSIEGGQYVDNSPKIGTVNGKVIVENDYLVLPGCTQYGHSFIVLSATDGGVETLCDFSGYRTPGGMTLNVHGSVDLDKIVDEIDDNNEHPDVEQAAMQCLQDIGITPVEIKAGWPEGRDASYGIFPMIDKMTLLLDTTSTENGLSRFNDYTALRENLG